MARVNVSKDVLLWALERSDKTPTNLQAKFPKIMQWLSGEIHPTVKQLETFAKTTLTPFGFFFLSKPPVEELPIPHFRTINDDRTKKPSANLLETINIIQRRQFWLREHLLEEGQNPFSFVNSVQTQDNSEDIANYIRETLGLPKKWAASCNSWENALVYLRDVIERVGIFTVINGIVGNDTHRKLDYKEFRGFVLVDEYAPFIFINGSDYKAAQMFTIAHELGHIFLGSSAAFDLRNLQPANDPIEIKCNQIAAEFLIPSDELSEQWKTVKNTQEPFQRIARRFKVSVLVAARRALDSRLIDKNQFFDFYNKYKVDERRKKSEKPKGGHFYNNQNNRVGRRFGLMVARAAKEGKLLYSDAFQLTGIYGKTFDKYISML